MKIFQLMLILILTAIFTSCGSIKSTLQNVDNTAIKPPVRNNQFMISEYASDRKYGYDKNYPINLGFENEKYSPKNIIYFFNALEGPNGEKISYIKKDDCCPFPSKKSLVGAGTLDLYEITLEGSDTKINLYLNIYEKGKVVCPKGLKIKKYIQD
ncbi:2-dehydro-3-deoxyphosphooctonate aldolase [Flavobacterium sp.]|uniref:2-dehydro-3-deoxyphosphooctonate aldolase n=1 Tax=Flavobacterium sp. TaxID=239 RepID=UPI003BBDEF09